ncbi:MAG: hypothetical protein GY820_02135, partial [Gammaproteobacteria bacterium]|nr:hypothetical protein [Gammaproteobacteria bacterium]
MSDEKNNMKEETVEENLDEENGQDRTTLGDLGDQVEKFANQTMDTIKKSFDKALLSRNTVLTIRVNEEANKKMEMLVDAGIFKSRSESAAFLIEEGVKHQDALFSKIASK